MTADYPARDVGSVAAGTTPDNPAGMLWFSSNGELPAVRSNCEAIQNVSLITEPAIVPTAAEGHSNSFNGTPKRLRDVGVTQASWRGRSRLRLAVKRKIDAAVARVTS